MQLAGKSPLYLAAPTRPSRANGDGGANVRDTRDYVLLGTRLTAAVRHS